MFLDPKMVIIIRNQQVQTRNFAKTLDKIEKHTFNGIFFSIVLFMIVLTVN
jgi:hypothetical protein